MALVTDDLRLYHRLVPVFEHRGITLLGLRPGEPVPDTVKALLAGDVEDPRSLPVRDDRDATLLAVLQRLDDRPTAHDGYGRVVVGVDPGDTIGLAVVADGLPLLVTEVRDPQAVAARVAAWRTGLHARSWTVHVGDGSPSTGRRITAQVEGRTGIQCRFVPEASTTPTSPQTGSRHADAAIHIALRGP